MVCKFVVNCYWNCRDVIDIWITSINLSLETLYLWLMCMSDRDAQKTKKSYCKVEMASYQTV